MRCFILLEARRQQHASSSISSAQHCTSVGRCNKVQTSTTIRHPHSSLTRLHVICERVHNGFVIGTAYIVDIVLSSPSTSMHMRSDFQLWLLVRERTIAGLRSDDAFIKEEYAKCSTEGAAMQVEFKEYRTPLHDHLVVVSFASQSGVERLTQSLSWGACPIPISSKVFGPLPAGEEAECLGAGAAAGGLLAGAGADAGAACGGGLCCVGALCGLGIGS